MKKVFKAENIDCANCAAKMSERILKLDGVTKASFNFLTEKFTFEAPDDKFDELLDKAIKLTKEFEPDWEIKA